MGLFSRRRAEVRAADTDDTDQGTTRPDAGATTGPWDVADAPDTPRIDLGSLRVPAVDGMQMRMDAPRDGGSAAAVVLILGGSTLELRAFAAPRTAGIWEDLRAEYEFILFTILVFCSRFSVTIPTLGNFSSISILLLKIYSIILSTSSSFFLALYIPFTL